MSIDNFNQESNLFKYIDNSLLEYIKINKSYINI